MSAIWEANGITNTKQKSVVQVNADLIRYVNATDISGWITTKGMRPTALKKGASKTEIESYNLALHDHKLDILLCKYTSVLLLGKKNGWVNFKVLDGAKKGLKLCLTTKKAADYLGTKAPKSKEIEVVVTYGKCTYDPKKGRRDTDEQWATLSVDGINAKVTLASVFHDAESQPLTAGEYKIYVPDHDHDSHYRSQQPSLKYDQIWFRTSHPDNERYIHPGLVSFGCVTVVDFDKWDEIHEKLISHRSADKKTVGKLIVKSAPKKTH